LIRNKTVFVSDQPDYVAAFDLNSGTFAWQKNDLGLLTGPMAADDAHLYVVTYEGVVALDGISGAIQWQTNLPTDGAYHEVAAIEQEQMVIYGNIHPFTNDQVLYALDSGNGDIIWQVELPGSLDWYRPSSFQGWQQHSAVAYHRGQIYLRLALHIGEKSGTFFTILSLDAQDGAELWRFDFGVKQFPGEAPSFGADSLAFSEEAVFIPTFLGPLYVLDPRFGLLKGTSDKWWTSPVRVDGLNVAYVSGEGLVAFDRQFTKIRWTFQDENLVNISSQIVSLQDYIFVEAHRFKEIHIAILEPTSGERVGAIIPSNNTSEYSKPLTFNTCGNQLCLVTLNCIYQFSIVP
jgi:outer membrane protein assembly factor BamB